MAIIGISGYIGSGKDTVGNFMKNYLEKTTKEGWEIRKFAARVKEIASLLTGISIEKFEDQEFKKTLLPKEWGLMSVRGMLQRIGTDCMRNNLHRDTWVNALMAGYRELSVVRDKEGNKIFDKQGNHQFKYPNWIITDVRFPNEAKAIKDREGIMIRINRETSLELHESETALEGWKFDYVIDNKGSLEDLKNETINLIEYVRATTALL